MVVALEGGREQGRRSWRSCDGNWIDPKGFPRLDISGLGLRVNLEQRFATEEICILTTTAGKQRAQLLQSMPLCEGLTWQLVTKLGTEVILQAPKSTQHRIV